MAIPKPQTGFGLARLWAVAYDQGTAFHVDLLGLGLSGFRGRGFGDFPLSLGFGGFEFVTEARKFRGWRFGLG